VVGTEGGKMEIWNIEYKKIVKFIDAHGDCNEGISSIVELKNPSYLIRGERKEADPNVRFVISAGFDKNEFKIWKLVNRHEKFKRPEFTFHIKISTSLRGIRAVLASSPDQIVCVDNEKTLKFYNFIDKVAQ
jgi:WD40 repeat protein